MGVSIFTHVPWESESKSRHEIEKQNGTPAEDVPPPRSWHPAPTEAGGTLFEGSKRGWGDVWDSRGHPPAHTTFHPCPR